MSITSEPARENQLWTSVVASVRRRFQNLATRACAICAAFAILLCVLIAFKTPPFYQLLSDGELKLQDGFFALRETFFPNGRGKASSVSDIVLISAGNESARRLSLDEDQPWPRTVFGALLKKLEQAHAAVIVLDVPLDGPSKYKPHTDENLDKDLAKLNIEIPKAGASAEGINYDDLALIEQLKASKNLLLASGVAAISGETVVPLRAPYAPFVDAVGADTGSVGNDAITADGDGVVRHAQVLFDQLSPWVMLHKSLALRVAEKRAGVHSVIDEHNTVILKSKVLPSVIRLNFNGDPGTFKSIPLWQALTWNDSLADDSRQSKSQSGGQSRSQPRGQSSSVDNPFENKIVLIGKFDPSWSNTQQEVVYGNSESNYLTPLSTTTAPMTGVEVQANAIANVLDGSFLREPEDWQIVVAILLSAALVAAFLSTFPFRPWLSAGVIAAAGFVWAAVDFSLFMLGHTLIPCVVPLAGFVIPASIAVLADQRLKLNREKAKQTRLFRSLAAKPLALEIERRLLAELGLAGRRMDVTVMACQLNNFIDDSSAAEDVLQKFNKCLAEMMQSIGEHGGLVERIWNCGVIGMWGAPIQMDESAQALQAAKCVIDITNRMRALKTSEQEDWYVTSSISTGEAICGTINATARDSILTHYGALGRCVDEAVELEAVNTKYGTTCAISRRTARLLESQYELRELDTMTINHQEEPIFELLSAHGPLGGVAEEGMELFRRGKTAFSEGRYRDAEQLFSTSLSMVPGDKPSQVMLGKCRQQIEKISN